MTATTTPPPPAEKWAQYFADMRSFAADKVLTPVVEDLVVAVGVVRLTAVSNVYKPTYAADLHRTAAAAITSCTSAAPSPSPTR